MSCIWACVEARSTKNGLLHTLGVLMALPVRDRDCWVGCAWAPCRTRTRKWRPGHRWGPPIHPSNMRQSGRLPLILRLERLCHGKHRLDLRQLDVLNRLVLRRRLRHRLLFLLLGRLLFLLRRRRWWLRGDVLPYAVLVPVEELRPQPLPPQHPPWQRGTCAAGTGLRCSSCCARGRT